MDFSASTNVARALPGLPTSGVPSRAELAACPGRAPLSVMERKGRIACVECLGSIPCDPCVAACPLGAISKREIADVPVLDPEKCTGCALCIPACPGQAIFVIDMLAGQVTLPHEFSPVLNEGDRVDCLGRDGRIVQVGQVLNVGPAKRHDSVSVVTVQVAPAACDEVRAIRAKGGRW